MKGLLGVVPVGQLFPITMPATVAAGSVSNLVLYAVFFGVFNFAHRARCAIAIRLRPAAEIVRLGLTVPPPRFEADFAHRAFCAMLIFLRAGIERARLGSV